VWHALRPLFEGVIRTGEAFWAKDHPFFLHRQGFLEETYDDVSYDPVRIEDGSGGGIFYIVNEQTRRVLGERRLRTLRDLGTRTADAKSAEEVCREATAALRKGRVSAWRWSRSWSSAMAVRVGRERRRPRKHVSRVHPHGRRPESLRTVTSGSASDWPHRRSGRTCGVDRGGYTSLMAHPCRSTSALWQWLFGKGCPSMGTRW
jgi:hypothetical protein